MSRRHRVSPAASRDGADAEAAGGASASAFPTPLVLWLSPAFPVGAFAYSHGLEWAAEQGLIKDRATLEAWLADLADLGALRNDLVLAACAWRAATASDAVALADVTALAAALQPSAERRLEATQQGQSFLEAIAAAWPCATVDLLRRAAKTEFTYAVAVAVAAAGHRIALQSTLTGYGVAFLSNLVSAAVRLGVVGQTDGQRVLAALVPRVDAAVRVAATATLDDLGGAAWISDFASLAHETQYTRLFRS
jgi:urease accessory protein